MSVTKYTVAQMIAAVKQTEAGWTAEVVGRELGVSKHAVYAWKAKYAGMDVPQAEELKHLRDENGRLKKLVADLSLEKGAVQSVLRKNCWSSQRGRQLASSSKGSTPSASGGPADRCCWRWGRFGIVRCAGTRG